MSKPSAPAAPDPQATAAAQTQSNKETALTNAALNRINQYTPYGSSIYTTDGTDSNGVPSYTQTVSLSPEQQQLYNMSTQGQLSLGNTALGQLGNLQSAYANPFSFGGPQVTGQLGNAGNIQTSFQNQGPGIKGQVDNGDYAAQIKQAQDAAYNAQTQYLDPQFQQQGDRLDAKLANQGLQVGDRAYDSSQGDFSRQRQSAYDSAMNNAIQAGNQEQNVLFGQDLSRGNFQNAANQQGFEQAYNQAQFGNAAQNQQFGQNLSAGNFNNSASGQALQQAMALYNQPLNSYNALATGSQVTNPTFSSVPTANQANTDVAGITNSAYQNQLNAYKNSQSGLNNLFSLGGTLGGAAIGKWG